MSLGSQFVIVTHAGPMVGGGHMSRCLALAQGLDAQGAGVCWMVNGYAKEMLRCRQIPEESVTVIESLFDSSGGLSPEAERSGAALFVVDSYDASPAFLDALRRLAPVAFVDDCRGRPVERECDILLNYNLGAENLGYVAGLSELLLGPQYVLLRREFWTWMPSEGETLLIIPGASDMLRVGESFVEWWREDWPVAELVLGPFVEPGLASRIIDAASSRLNLAVTSNPADLPERMARAGRVLCTSSVTCYEALALRKPLGVFQVAGNQLPIGEAVQTQGLGTNLGPWGTWGPEELEGWLRSDLPPPPAVVNPRGALAAAAELVKVL